jgi:uncharacterized tellurite resistance protein B-like protein
VEYVSVFPGLYPVVNFEGEAAMAFSKLGNVLNIFSGSSTSEMTQDELYEEVLLTTLAQASRADANIHPVEIETIQQIMLRETGQELTEADIRKASRSEVNGSTKLRKYLRNVQSRLNDENKTMILRGLVDVIKSDTHINVLEIDFFNRVADALRISSTEQFELTA